MLEVRWLQELEDPRLSRQEAGDPSRAQVMETARLADPLVAKHPPLTGAAVELFVRIYLRAHRRDPATALVRRFGVFWLPPRPSAAIAAEPQCLPNSYNSACAEAPPLAATASTSGRSSAKRSISSNGGDWLKTSWVADVAWLMADPKTVNHFRGIIGKS